MARPSPLQLFLAATGAVVPPAVLEGGLPSVELRRFPPGSRRLDLAVPGDDGARLRGVVVPAEEGAPVVLNLLESEGSVTYGAYGLHGYPCLWRLRDLGLTTIMADWEGVGASTGKRSPRNLERDAQVLWERALEEADGNPGRIVIRAASLGTIATATLIENGARPAGVILIAPVRAETVVKNWARQHIPEAIARFATGLIRDAVRVDVVEVYSKLDHPLLVYAPRTDYLLPGWERVLYEEAVEASHGVWIDSEYGHGGCVLHARTMLDEERAFLRRLFPSLPPVDDRVSEALAGLPPERAERLLQNADASAALQRICALYRFDLPSFAALIAERRWSPQQEKLLIAWLRLIPAQQRLRLDIEAQETMLGTVQSCPDPERALAQCLELSTYLEILQWGELPDNVEDVLPEDREEDPDPWTLHRLLRLARDLGFVDVGENGDGGRMRALLLQAAGIPSRRSEGRLEAWQDGAWVQT